MFLMGGISPKVEQLIVDTVIVGVIDNVSVQSIDASAEQMFAPSDIKDAVLECLSYVLSNGLMVITTVIDGEYVPYVGETSELIDMVSTNYLYDDERGPRGDEYTFLYWMLNTIKGDDAGKRWLDEFHRGGPEQGRIFE